MAIQVLKTMMGKSLPTKSLQVRFKSLNLLLLVNLLYLTSSSPSRISKSQVLKVKLRRKKLKQLLWYSSNYWRRPGKQAKCWFNQMGLLSNKRRVMLHLRKNSEALSCVLVWDLHQHNLHRRFSFCRKTKRQIISPFL